MRRISRFDKRHGASGAYMEALETRALLSATIYQPLTSTALTSALQNCQLGDTIILQAGTTYTGSFTLPVKSTGSGWITIESSSLASLADGVRVGPSDAANMPKIVAPGGNACAIIAAPGSHDFKMLGLEIIGPANNSDLTALVQLGTTDSTQNTLASMPYDFVIDRCYMHPNVNSAQVRRAIALNSGATDITNSYITEIHQNGSDSQAIGGANGSGPYNILNNYLAAGSENILFGGSGCYVPNTVPSNIVVRGNYLTKPTSWMGTWDVKNLFELKEGSNVLVDGNIFENDWNSAQDGTAIVIKLDQYSASRPWQVTQDVTFTNNIVRHAANGIALQGRDYTDNSPAGLVRRITINNNLFDDINKSPWATWNDPNAIGGNLLYLTQGPQYVTFTHNTAINSRTTINVDSSNVTYPAVGFIYQNNIAAHNTYGVFSSNYGTGDNTITNFFDNQSGGAFTKNILMGGPSNSYKNHPGNFFPATWNAVGFVDFTNGNYRLASTSPYKNAGTDGKDLGANFDTIDTETAGSISGAWPAALQGVSVNAGAAQRSMVNQLTVTFNQPITLTAGAFDLVRRDGTSIAYTATPSADLMTYVLTFNGTGTTSGWLNDGIYDFTVHVANLRDSFNMAPHGSDQTTTFHRLFGDSDGDGDVDNLDALRFKVAQGSVTSSSNYHNYFDFDNDGDIDNLDALHFKANQGKSFVY